MSLTVFFEEYGGANVPNPRDQTLPEPRAGEVRIANRAISVNPIDWKLVAGHVHDFHHLRFPAVPGNETASIIIAVGPDVDAFTAGDEVIWTGFTEGYRAEANVAPASSRQSPTASTSNRHPRCRSPAASPTPESINSGSGPATGCSFTVRPAVWAAPPCRSLDTSARMS
jgi:NADPH:quinone reductase-like Zn-dependent oxidoreductase